MAQSNAALNTLTQALQSLTGSQDGSQPVGLPGLQQDTTQQTQQPPFDPNQLFEQLISTGLQNRNTPFSQRNHFADSVSRTSPLETDNQHPIESQATSQAIQNGADPSLLNMAKQYLGKNAYIGLCEAFVERMTQGAEGLYRSAADAWNQHQNKTQGLSGIQPGDAVYFAPDPSNGYNGHTGVYAGNNKFISATYNGVKEYDLNDWQKSTGQKVLGYVREGQHTPTPLRTNQPQQQPMQQPLQQTQQPVAPKPPQNVVKPQPVGPQKGPTFPSIPRPTLGSSSMQPSSATQNPFNSIFGAIRKLV